MARKLPRFVNEIQKFMMWYHNEIRNLHKYIYVSDSPKKKHIVNNI